MQVDDIIRDATNESDIGFRSEIYGEIARHLTDTGLNLAFFVFTTSERSSCARTLDGHTVSCPVLNLYLRYDADFRETGIDPHFGNWEDQWARTRTVRDAVNEILQRHGFDDNYVSGHTFIFVRTLEQLAFREIGRVCKKAVQELVCAEAPGVAVTHVFWNGHGYDVILRDKDDYRRVKRKVKTKVAKELPKVLEAADKNRYCKSYNATIEFGYTGMNLFHLIREDIA